VETRLRVLLRHEVVNAVQMANLHEAALRGNLTAVTDCIQGGANVDETRETVFNNSCSTALHVAAENGSVPCVQYLLEQGADAQITDLWGHTAAHLAAQEGHTDVLQVCHQSNLQLCEDTQQCQLTLWHVYHLSIHNVCLSTTNATTMQALIEHDPIVKHIIDDAEQTVLHIAAKSGNTACVKALLTAGAPVDPSVTLVALGAVSPVEAGAQIASVMHAAAAAGALDSLSLLIQAARSSHTPLDLVDAFRRTPVHAAAAAGHVDCMRELLAAGASPQATNAWGATPLHMAIKGSHVEAAHVLIALGGTASTSDNYGFSPLHLAAECGDVALVRELLAAGADKDCVSKQLDTPLSIASQREHIAVIQALVQAGASLRRVENLLPDLSAVVRMVLQHCMREISLAAVASMMRFAAGHVDAALGVGEINVSVDLHHAVLCKVFDVEERCLRLLLNSEAGGF
jgi:ankyrin repeat protein